MVFEYFIRVSISRYITNLNYKKITQIPVHSKVTKTRIPTLKCRYAPFLANAHGYLHMMILILVGALTSASIYGTSKLSVESNFRKFVPSSSYVWNHFRAYDKYVVFEREAREFQSCHSLQHLFHCQIFSNINALVSLISS